MNWYFSIFLNFYFLFVTSYFKKYIFRFSVYSNCVNVNLLIYLYIIWNFWTNSMLFSSSYLRSNASTDSWIVGRWRSLISWHVVWNFWIIYFRGWEQGRLGRYPNAADLDAGYSCQSILCFIIILNRYGKWILFNLLFGLSFIYGDFDSYFRSTGFSMAPVPSCLCFKFCRYYLLKIFWWVWIHFKSYSSQAGWNWKYHSEPHRLIWYLFKMHWFRRIFW